MDFLTALGELRDPMNWAFYAPPAMLVLALSALLAGWLKLKKGVKTNYTRKVFHIINFTYAAMIYLVGSTVAVVIYGGFGLGAMLVCLFLKDGNILLEGIAREQDAPHRKLYLIVPFLATAIAGIIDNSLFTRFAVVGYLVSGWGDAAGEPVGVRWGKHRYKVPSMAGVKCTRSIEGSIGVFAASVIGAFIALQISRIPLLPSIPIAFAAAGVATLVEAVSSHGLDNFTVQISATVIAFSCALAGGLA
jgi:phytol kinase